VARSGELASALTLLGGEPQDAANANGGDAARGADRVPGLRLR
jgi:hypothetical protein